MATKPTERILDWSSAGTNTDPGVGKEAAGWLVAERPPAYWWNWILNSFGKWLTWSETSIDALEDADSKAFGQIDVASGVATRSTNTVGLSGQSTNSLTVDLTFSTAFTSTDYFVQVTSSAVGDYTFSVFKNSGSSCSIYIKDGGTAVVPNDSGTNINFMIDAKGPQ